jgi:hypothetical protein
VIFRSIKDIANGIFSGDSGSSDFMIDSWSSSNTPDFTDL